MFWIEKVQKSEWVICQKVIIISVEKSVVSDYDSCLIKLYMYSHTKKETIFRKG